MAILQNHLAPRRSLSRAPMVLVSQSSAPVSGRSLPGYPPPAMKARIALGAATRALGLTIVNGPIDLNWVVVAIPWHLPHKAVANAGFKTTEGRSGTDGVEIGLDLSGDNASLAATLSRISRLGRLLQDNGGKPDIATALDIAVEIFGPR